MTNNSGGNLYQCYINIGYIDTSMFFTTSAYVSFNLSSTSQSINYVVVLVFISSINTFNFPRVIIPVNSNFVIDTTSNGYNWPYNFNDGKIYNVYLTIISNTDLSGISVTGLNFAFNGPICSNFTGYTNNYGYNGACICDVNYSPSGNVTTFTSVGGPGISSTQQSIGSTNNIVLTAGAGTGYVGYSYYSQNGSVIYYYNNTATPTVLTLSGCSPNSLLCPPGYYCPSGSTVKTSAIACPTGSYCKIGSTSPTPCASGYYCPYQSGVQLTCPQGYYCPTGTGSPIICSSGYYCSVGSGSQIPCPSGYISSTVGSTVCTPCQPGYFTPTAGNSSCTSVSAGSMSSQWGSSSGSICQIGTYQNQIGQASCINCPSGYYCPTTAMTATGPSCSSGYYCPAGTGVQTVCQSGYYSPLGSGSCNPITCTSLGYTGTSGACTCSTGYSGTVTYTSGVLGGCSVVSTPISIPATYSGTNSGYVQVITTTYTFTAPKTFSTITLVFNNTTGTTARNPPQNPYSYFYGSMGGFSIGLLAPYIGKSGVISYFNNYVFSSDTSNNAYIVPGQPRGSDITSYGNGTVSNILPSSMTTPITIYNGSTTVNRGDTIVLPFFFSNNMNTNNTGAIVYVTYNIQ